MNNNDLEIYTEKTSMLICELTARDNLAEHAKYIYIYNLYSR